MTTWKPIHFFILLCFGEVSGRGSTQTSEKETRMSLKNCNSLVQAGKPAHSHVHLPTSSRSHFSVLWLQMHFIVFLLCSPDQKKIFSSWKFLKLQTKCVFPHTGRKQNKVAKAPENRECPSPCWDRWWTTWREWTVGTQTRFNSLKACTLVAHWQVHVWNCENGEGWLELLDGQSHL